MKDENRRRNKRTIRNAFNEYLNAVDKVILENQALQIELQHLKQENEELRYKVEYLEKEIAGIDI